MSLSKLKRTMDVEVKEEGGPSTALTAGRSTAVTAGRSTAVTAGRSTAVTAEPSTAVTAEPSTAVTAGPSTAVTAGPSTAVAVPKATERDARKRDLKKLLLQRSLMHNAISNTADLSPEDLKKKYAFVINSLALASKNATVKSMFLNGRLARTKLTPLHMEKVHVGFLKLLIGAGADPKAVTSEGLNFVQCAVRNRSPSQFHDVVKLVLSLGLKDLLLAKIGDAKTNLLQYSQGYLLLLEDTVKLLESAVGLNLNDKDGLGFNTLFHAVMSGRDEKWLEQLVKLGADWKAVDNYEANILHVAATYRNVEAIKYFARLGVDVEAKDKQGRTPFDCVVATEFGLKDRDETIFALIELGANFMEH